MKKPPNTSKQKTVPAAEPVVHADAFFKELDIAERTQKPPSEELILRLNLLASTPPFSYRHKVKENDPL